MRGPPFLGRASFNWAACDGAPAFRSDPATRRRWPQLDTHRLQLAHHEKEKEKVSTSRARI